MKLLTTKNFNDLRKELTKRYYNEQEVTGVLVDIGFLPGEFKLGGTAKQMWNFAISRIEKHGKLPVLLNHVLEKSKENTVFLQLKSDMAKGLAYIEPIRPVPANAGNGRGRVILVHHQVHDAVEELLGYLDLAFTNTGVPVFSVDDWEHFQREIQVTDTCDIFVMVLSIEFFMRRSLCMEMAYSAKAAGVRIVPLLLQTCWWDRVEIFEGIVPTPVSGKFVSEWPDPRAAFHQISKELRNLFQP